MKTRKATLPTTLTSAALCLALLAAPQRSWSFAEQTPTDHGAPPAAQPQPEVVDCNAIAGGIVIGLGVAAIYIIWRLCKLLPPPAPPSPPPPPPPPLTNPPPPLKTNGPVKVFLKLDGPPPLPQPTNAPCTNCPPPKPPPLVYWIPPVWRTNNVSVTNSMGSLLAYDISANGYMDTNGGAPTSFMKYIVGTITNLASSADLVNWSNYTFAAWVSSNGTEVVLYDGAGNGVYAAYKSNSPYPGNSTGVATNQFPLGVWVGGSGLKEFHKAYLNSL